MPACLPLLACSSSARHHVLTTFFDGVPEPDTTAVATTLTDKLTTREVLPAEGTTGAPPPVSFTLHAPYEDKACDECHLLEGTGRFGRTVRLRLPLRELCVECHDDMEAGELRSGNRWVHGPVAAGICTGCHSPHTALFPSLLLAEPGEKLCGRCHDIERIGAEPVHSGTVDNCLTCHEPHAGETAAFSRGSGGAAG